MKIGKKKASVIGIVVVALLVAVSTTLFMQHSGLTPKAYIVFAGDSNPDGYGNMVEEVIIYQDLTGEFEAVYVLGYDEYTEGMTVEIDANYLTVMRVTVRINKTLCDDSMQKAIERTRVYWNISTVCENKLGVQTGGVQGVGDYYLVPYLSDEWTPASDTVYDCAVKYEAYY